MSKSVQLSLDSTPYATSGDMSDCIYSALSNLVEISKYSQQKFHKMRQHVEEVEWIDSYCSVALNHPDALCCRNVLYKYIVRSKLNSLVLTMTDDYVDALMIGIQAKDCGMSMSPSKPFSISSPYYTYRVISDRNSEFSINLMGYSEFFDLKGPDLDSYIQNVFLICPKLRSINTQYDVCLQLSRMSKVNDFRIFMVVG